MSAAENVMPLNVVLDADRHAVIAAVKDGLERPAGTRMLPPWLFYDDEGSRLFDAITRLPEYYLTRAEREIFESQAGDIVEEAAQGGSDRLHVVELGAGTAEKTTVILRALVLRQGRALYMPIDVSGAALDVAVARLQAELPKVDVRPVASRYDDAMPAVEQLGPRRLVLWIGSSIGNYSDVDAITLLQQVRKSLLPGGCVLIGADKKKSPHLLLPAYDDRQGITAAFNKNMLVRLNRELGATFDVASFAHRAVWNEAQSQVEMHLESSVAQTVSLGAAGFSVSFAAGERIHTESSVKYDDARIAKIVAAAGFVLERSTTDRDELFGVHLARAV
jgi:L-histidine N-alpha-methyltransferase